jgi:hypothetical protein
MQRMIHGEDKSSFGQILKQEIQGWYKFRRVLRKEDQQVFDRLFEKARLHVEAGGSASRSWPFETILISMLLEHEKGLVDLRSRIDGYIKRRKGRGYLSVDTGHLKAMRTDDLQPAKSVTSVTNL